MWPSVTAHVILISTWMNVYHHLGLNWVALTSKELRKSEYVCCYMWSISQATKFHTKQLDYSVMTMATENSKSANYVAVRDDTERHIYSQHYHSINQLLLCDYACEFRPSTDAIN